MNTFIAAIDQGTTSTRCMLFGKDGIPVAVAQSEHRQIYPAPGLVEHDAMEIWHKTRECITAAMKQAGITPRAIAAVGITNQRETTIVWDKRTGRPLHNALVWQDTRTAALVDEMKEARGGIDAFRPVTGLPLSTYFSAFKLVWLIANVKIVREAVDRGNALFGTIDTWLIWNLTGGADGGMHITDVTNASRTMLMDIQTLSWREDICDAFGIPPALLPRICSNSEEYGYTRDTGPFGARLPIMGSIGDQQAATLGQACLLPGNAKNTYGTGCFTMLNTGTAVKHSRHGLVTTVCYKRGDAPAIYAVEGSVAIGGALVQWLRDNLKIIDTAPLVEELARSVDDNGGIYFVPAFSGLYAPYWRDDARGVIVGLTRYVNRGHFARAALEATAYQTRDILDAMAGDAGIEIAALKVDGGMVHNELLMQFQADLLGVPIVRPKVAETTALGAAYAAGLAAGYWESEDQICENWAEDKRWMPDGRSDAPTRLYAQWKRAVERTYGWVE
ncbi:MAG: glycerol kinase GlpK [Chitinivibrionales bacterium]|nr:glycerol kinase GlpK [Chitinivibrionales bacterium]MBD3394915.1 glycerol kinase GlpK [Chitinivibrionales bacterium]